MQESETLRDVPHSNIFNPRSMKASKDLIEAAEDEGQPFLESKARCYPPVLLFNLCLLELGEPAFLYQLATTM